MSATVTPRGRGSAAVQRAPGNEYLDDMPPPVIGLAEPLSAARLREMGERLAAIGAHWRLSAYTTDDGRQVLTDRDRQVVVQVERGEFLTIVQHCIRYAHDLYAEVLRLRTSPPSPRSMNGEGEATKAVHASTGSARTGDGAGGDQVDRVDRVDRVDQEAAVTATGAKANAKGKRKA